MAILRCKRFPDGTVPIRATDGTVVEFHNGLAEVDDAELVDALLDVPEVFGIELVGASRPAGGGDQGEQPGTVVMPVGMSVSATLDWVGHDPARARVALDAETDATGQSRSTLVARLEAILAEADKAGADSGASTQS